MTGAAFICLPYSALLSASGNSGNDPVPFCWPVNCIYIQMSMPYRMEAGIVMKHSCKLVNDLHSSSEQL